MEGKNNQEIKVKGQRKRRNGGMRQPPNLKVTIADSVRNELTKIIGTKPNAKQVHEGYLDRPDIRDKVDKLISMLDKSNKTMRGGYAAVGKKFAIDTAKSMGQSWANMDKRSKAQVLSEVLCDDIDPTMLWGLAKGAYDNYIEPLYNKFKPKVHSYLKENYPRVHGVLDFFNPNGDENSVPVGKTNQMPNIIAKSSNVTGFGSVMESVERIGVPSGGGYGFDDVYIKYIKCLFDPVCYQTRIPDTTDRTALAGNSGAITLGTNNAGNMGIAITARNIYNSTQGLGVTGTNNGCFMAVSNDASFNATTGQSAAGTVSNIQSALINTTSSGIMTSARIVGLKITVTPLSSSLNNSGVIEIGYFQNAPFYGFNPGLYTSGIPRATLQLCPIYQLRSCSGGESCTYFIPCNNDDLTLSDIGQAFNDDVIYVLITGAGNGTAAANFEIRYDYCIEYRPASAFAQVISVTQSPAGAGSQVAVINLMKTHPAAVLMNSNEARDFIGSLPGEEVVTYKQYLRNIQAARAWRPHITGNMSGGAPAIGDGSYQLFE
jgi:hypothetical protein